MKHNFNIIVDSLTVPTFVIDINHVVIAWNKACELLTGIAAPDIIGTKEAWRGFYKFERPCLADVVVDDQDRIGEHYSIHGDSKFSQGLHAEAWFDDLNGSRRYLTFDAEPIYNEEGELIGALENLEDITELKKTEQYLVESTEKLADANRLLQAILDSIPGGVFWKDLDSNYLGANVSFSRDGGLSSPEDLIGKSDYELPWAKWADNYRADDREVMASKMEKLNIIEQFTDSESNEKWLITNKVPLFKNHDELIGILGTYVDISELKEMEMMLLAAKEEAEKANHAKSEFLASMSHELRTPMNAVLGFSQLLVLDEENPLSDDQKISLSYIMDNGNHLLELINGVLDLSKIEMNHMEVNFEYINVHKLLSSIANIMTPEADKTNVSILMQSEKLEALSINADYNKLKQVLLNLSSNAIKYNSERGIVSFSYQQSNADKVKIAISDTGKGVPQADFPALFEPFNRLDKANSAILGTGIGLSISKKLIEEMGGEIGVFHNEDRGLTFWVELEAVVG